MAVRSQGEMTKLGSFCGEDDRCGGWQPFDRNRVIPAMAVTSARSTFFFDVADFSTRGYFPVAADHAAAAQSGKAEKSDETHVVVESSSF
jgi:hypothetical protein